MIRRRRRIRLISPRHATVNLSIFCSVMRVSSRIQFSREVSFTLNARENFPHNHDTFNSIQISIDSIRPIFICRIELFECFSNFLILHFSQFNPPPLSLSLSMCVRPRYTHTHTHTHTYICVIKR